MSLPTRKHKTFIRPPFSHPESSVLGGALVAIPAYCYAFLPARQRRSGHLHFPKDNFGLEEMALRRLKNRFGR